MKVRRPRDQSIVSQLKVIAGDSKSLALMSEKLDITRFVPTIFPSFNRAVVLGGAPLGAIWTVHGPYRGGKSAFALGLVVSFVKRGHAAIYLDAEHAVNRKWFQELGADPDSFLFHRPTTFEDTVSEVDSAIKRYQKGKETGAIHPDTALLIVVDSINKLTPEKELTYFTKEGPEAFEKGLGRMRAALLNMWLDRMVPIVGGDNIALVLVAQERELHQSSPWDPEFRVKGGQAILYDSQVQLRVVLAAKQWEEGKKGKKVLVGQAHRIIVFKNKVGYPNESGLFFTSNGKGEAPIGFDHIKSAVEEAGNRESRVVEHSGSWYSFGGERFHGEGALIRYLRENPQALQELCDALDADLKEPVDAPIADEIPDD